MGKCEYYLSHDKDRQEIAHNGFEKVKSTILMISGLLRCWRLRLGLNNTLHYKTYYIKILMGDLIMNIATALNRKYLEYTVVMLCSLCEITMNILMPIFYIVNLHHKILTLLKILYQNIILQ